LWPPYVGGLVARRAAAIEQRHHPAVVLEGSRTFVADDAGSLDLPDTSVSADVLWTDFLPYHSTRWFAVVDGRGRAPWTHQGDEETRLLVLASRSTPPVPRLPSPGGDSLLPRRCQSGGSEVRAGEDPGVTRRTVCRIGGWRRAQRRPPAGRADR
jgi:hypothetical protein